MLNESETANAFNVYFTELPQNTIRGEYGDINGFQTKLTSNYAELESMFLYEVDENEIFQIIMKLKNGFSTGTDGINTKIFKKCAITLSKILPDYINRSFETGVFPDCFKIAKVIPIFKKSGDKSEINNFRPISLLNIVSKVQETCMYNRLYSFLEKKNFFC